VLKPYFAKILRLKNVQVDIQAEFEHGKLISQMAVSEGVEKINREIIDVQNSALSKKVLSEEIMHRELKRICSISR
jgi:hypothetical protein